jgi:TIR domain
MTRSSASVRRRVRNKNPLVLGLVLGHASARPRSPVWSSRNHHGLGGLSLSGRESTGSARLSGVFINYRREDSGGHAGRLYDRLRQRYGPDHVFRDIDAIAPGVDYAQRIEAAIGTCDAVIVLIGRDWLDVRGPDGRRRLDDPGDVLRREIVAALARGILVIHPRAGRGGDHAGGAQAAR